MEKIEFTEIENKWLRRLKELKKDDLFNIYIDNPFCISSCKYCIYSHNITKIGSELYNKYYKEFLPNEINKYEKVLNERIPDTIYFGGGTASLMTEAIMEDIFNRIPNFEKIPNKVFENHPSLTTKRKIDLYSKYKFSYISFGIQSFDERIIKKENRIGYKLELVKELISYAQSKGIVINCDLLAFIDKGTKEDAMIIFKDLLNMEELLKPDIITVYPKVQALNVRYSWEGKYLYNNKGESDHNYELICALRREMLKFSRRTKDYYICPSTPMVLEYNHIINTAYENYYFLKIPLEKHNEIKRYSSSGYPIQPSNQNTLGIGGYLSRKPYSYHGKNFIYENLIDENLNVQYKLVKN